VKSFCGKPIASRSRFVKAAQRRCHLPRGHSGSCEEFPFVKHLRKEHRSVAEKIKRDATMTTGAAWKSKDAGPNRILRWVMLLSDEELLEYGLNMQALKPQVIAKLREKAADYDSCIEVAIKLTSLVYLMEGAPSPPSELRQYLEDFLGEREGVTCCEICLRPLSFDLFFGAQRGKAIIETCHKDPRQHNSENVGFAHRECNIAQGAMTLSEFYQWIREILERAEKRGKL